MEISSCETCIRQSPTSETPSNEATPESRTSSNDRFSYWALSYAWGDPTPCHPILVDGKRRIIAENLGTFLQAAKKDLATYGGWLWIDALSVDQSDAEERRHQVGIMSTIFRNASSVVVWLGERSDDSDLAMRSLWSNQLVEDYNKYQTFSKKWSKKMEKYMQDKEKCVADVLPAIGKLCERPYWKRLWVFQELRHAKSIELVCGRRRISWKHFRSIWRVVAELGMSNEDTAEMLKNSLATRIVTLRTKPMNFSLWNLLKETKDLECADQHGRVYALLSVADEGHEDIEADYNASIPCLGHRILRNRHKNKPPASLEGVIADCEFLADVLKVSKTDMFDCSDSHTGTWVDGVGSEDRTSWAEWAEYHRHPAVARLLENGW